MRALVALLLVAACSKSVKSEITDETVAAVKDYLAHDEIRLALFRLAAARPVGVDHASPEYQRPVLDAAPVVAPAFLAHWDKVTEYLLGIAKLAGVQRARHHEPSLDELGDILAQIATVSPELAAKWTLLAAEMKRVEAAAYDAEVADVRPLAEVVPVQEEAILLGQCAVKAMTAHFPTYRWELATTRSATITLTITTEKALAHYGGGTETTAMMTGMRATFTPVGIAGFTQPITSSGEADAPDEIHGGTVGGVQTGLGLLRRITASICADLDAKLH
jgi:hypothetical protein